MVFVFLFFKSVFYQLKGRLMNARLSVSFGEQCCLFLPPHESLSDVLALYPGQLLLMSNRKTESVILGTAANGQISRMTCTRRHLSFGVIPTTRRKVIHFLGQAFFPTSCYVASIDNAEMVFHRGYLPVTDFYMIASQLFEGPMDAGDCCRLFVGNKAVGDWFASETTFPYLARDLLATLGFTTPSEWPSSLVGRLA